ncbi:Squalene/phytoene synthase [Magnetococcus marinus MC-1]|uniref:Squalene/phytoene synthase n=1 Tax=Magnetococcus marinus (strain ATCC BAA-1437 / JCM 17883 / MC-1) TaxID=156889 RepID=A0L4E0_MAGMM|nr:presqualene diphosphate synthase HpnD [Magnetococcus marinus]ABK42833.1 Squalene/phytoene synthase [Magnetococcus marinus MC-1]
MTPDLYCQARVKRSGSSFYWPMRLLPAHKRRGLFALYAFCREVDDIVDRQLDPRAAHMKLAWWHEEIVEVFTGQPRHPVARALHALKDQYGWQMAPFIEILQGMEMDLQPRNYENWQELEGYCHKVSVAVGLAALPVFGVTGERAQQFAHHLGMALQLTNILRDLFEDGQMGRVYLPQTVLQAHGVQHQGILDGEWQPALVAALQEVDARIESHFAQARELVQGEHFAQLTAARSMGAVYHARLRRIRAAGYRVDQQPAQLSKSYKLWLCLRCWLASRVGWLRAYDAL